MLGSATVTVSAAMQSVVGGDAVLGGSSGWGVRLTVAGGAVLAGVAIFAVFRRLRPKPATVLPHA